MRRPCRLCCKFLLWYNVFVAIGNGIRKGHNMNPTRIKILFEGGVAEIYGDIFADMATVYALALYDRQKAAKAKLAAIDLGDDNRRAQFNTAAHEYDDAESRLAIIDQVEKVFKNRGVATIEYVQPGREQS